MNKLGTNILVQPAASVLFCYPDEQRNRFILNIPIIQASQRHLNTPNSQDIKYHTTDGIPAPLVCLHMPHYSARSEEMRNKKINRVEQEKNTIKYNKIRRYFYFIYNSYWSEISSSIETYLPKTAGFSDVTPRCLVVTNVSEELATFTLRV
jgi:hypothetical protein